GRNQMRVGAQQRVESGDLELVAENVDRIGAVDIERARAEQLVPELLDPDRGRVLTGLPKQPDHLAVRPESRAWLPFLQRADGRSDDALEQRPVRLPG